MKATNSHRSVFETPRRLTCKNGAHFVACISDHGAFFWKSIERMTRNEESRLDVVFLKKLQQAPDAHSSGEDACVRI